MARPVRRFWPAGLALLLASCALFESAPPEPPATAKRPSEPVAALPPAAPSPRIPGRKPPVPPSGPALPATPGAPEPTPLTLDRVMGMTPEDATGLLGAPGQRAEVPPATVWRYAAGGCELDLYFYLDLQSRVTRVLHYEFRSADGGDGQRCLERLVAEERSRDNAAAAPDRPR